MRSEFVTLVGEPFLESLMVVSVNVLNDLFVVMRVFEMDTRSSTFFYLLSSFPVLVFAISFAKDGSTTEASTPSNQVNGGDSSKIMEAFLGEPTTTPSPGGNYWIDESSLQEREHDICIKLSSLG